MSADNDLAALVFTVAPATPTVTTGFLGRAVYAAFLKLVGEQEPALAEALHGGHGRKPFTCSTLVGGRRQGKNERKYLPDDPAWLRITGLNAAVSRHLQRLAAAPPATIELDGALFQVLAATTDAAHHPWAGANSYQAMAAPLLLGKQSPPRRLQLIFASPTTFRSGGKSYPIPMPQWVFGNLLDCWNTFSTIPLSTEGRRFAETCVVLTRYNLETRAIPMKGTVTEMGCVGRARYHLLERDRYWAAVLNLLTEYAFYNGVGYQTTVGLGRARCARRREHR